MKNIGIVICSRYDSRRVPDKPFVPVNGKPILIRLLDRLFNTGIPVFLAVPEEQRERYDEKINGKRESSKVYRGSSITLFSGDKDDPLKRTYDLAKHHKLQTIIRVTHDKIFVDFRQISYFVRYYAENKLDYLFSTNFIDGMSFEVFDFSVLEAAHQRFKNVEHLSFALDAVAKNKQNLKSFPFSLAWSRRHNGKRVRLLIDFHKDVEYMHALLKHCGNQCEIEDIIHAPDHLHAMNRPPEVTIYTCSYNDHKHLHEAIVSALQQRGVEFEYILVDDGSTDPSVERIMRHYERMDDRVRVIRNEKNAGLASASRCAVEAALGKFVIRIDADDAFYSEHIVSQLLRFITVNNCDAVYPDNLKGQNVQRSYEQHHAGGAMFRKKALDYVQFTDGLRHFEGWDLYERIKEKGLRIGYWNEIGFYYRQRPNSLSNRPSIKRQKIAAQIASGKRGKDLIA